MSNGSSKAGSSEARGQTERELEARYSGPNLSVAAHRSPYPTRRLDPAISLVDTAREIAEASSQIAHQTHAQLELIHSQIQFLQAQARAILDKASRDVALHRAECRFSRVPGQLYHLYRRGDGSSFFSMLSPEDHGGFPPHEHLGSYWLEADRTWTEDGAPRKRPAQGWRPPNEQIPSTHAALENNEHGPNPPWSEPRE